MTLNQNILKLIKDFPVEEYLDSHSIQYTQNDRYYTLGECINPACNKEKKMILNKDERYFLCFVCGEHGSLIDFISSVDHISYQQARSIICDRKTYTSDSQITSKIEDSVDPTYDLDEIELPPFFKDININDDSDVSRYLKNERGFTQELIDLFNVKFNPYDQRVIFPIYDEWDKLVAYQARDITGKSEFKILTKPNGFRKSWVVYNWNNSKDQETLTLTEGPIDCIKAYQMNSVALFGKQISKQQLSIIMSNKNLRRINIALDPDAKKQITELAQIFAPLYDTRVIDLPNNKGDIGDCSIELANDIIEKSEQFNTKLSSGII